MIKDNKISMLLDNFKIKEYKEILPITSGTANKNHIIRGCRGAYIGDLVLRRRSLKYSSELQMLFEEEYLRHIYSKGIPVPVPLRSKNEQCWYNIDGNTYQIYPFIAGGEFDCSSYNDVVEGGIFLGRLHSAVSDLMPVNERYLPRYDDPDIIIDVICKTIDKNCSKIPEKYRKTLEYIIGQTIMVKEKVPDNLYNELPNLIIHGDYHPANVKYDNGKICGLFDFDWISRQPRIRDVVDGVIYFSSRRNENIISTDIFSLTSGYSMDVNRIRIFILAYNENVSLPLTLKERNCIPHLICARLIHSRVQALPKIPEERAFEMLTHGMEEILNWVNDNCGKV